MGCAELIFSARFHDTLDEELMVEYTERHIPADTNGGWPFASGVILLRAGAASRRSTYMHKQTYRHPTDVTWHGQTGIRRRRAGH